MKGSNADPYVADVALPNAELGDYSVPTDWPTNVRHNAPGDVPGAPVMFEDDDQSDIKAGYGFESDNLYEGDWFFFHTDHLGSTSYLTDTAGNVSQFVCYTPYGEAIVDEHLTTYENPFKFSGKELDDITGLYDHGARSRNPISTLWYGVDPLWEKYPDFSPYNYCAGNPVVYVDPDGRDKKYYFSDGRTKKIHDENAFTVTYIVLGEKEKDFNPDNNPLVIPAPSKEVVEKMKEAYEKTESEKTEVGFCVNEKGQCSDLVQGTGNRKENKDIIHGEISDQKMSSVRNEVNDGGKLATYDVHSHNNVIVYNKDGIPIEYTPGTPDSSDPDKKGYNSIRNNGIYNVVLGYRELTDDEKNNVNTFNQTSYRQVGFYNNINNIGTKIDFNILENAAR